MELPKVLCILACLMSPGLSFSVLPAYATVPDSTCFLASAFLLCAETPVKVLPLRIAIVRRGADAHLGTQNMLSICIEVAKRLIQCCRVKQLGVVFDLLNELKGFMYAVEHHWRQTGRVSGCAPALHACTQGVDVALFATPQQVGLFVQAGATHEDSVTHFLLRNQVQLVPGICPGMPKQVLCCGRKSRLVFPRRALFAIPMMRCCCTTRAECVTV